jgi:hypothetical protein
MRKAEKFQAGETLRRDIGPKLNVMVDRVNRDIKGDGKTTEVRQVGSDLIISANQSPVGGGGGGGALVVVPWSFMVSAMASTYNVTAGTVRVERGGVSVDVPVSAVSSAAIAGGTVFVKITIPYEGTITAEIVYQSSGEFVTFSGSDAVILWPLAVLEYVEPIAPETFDPYLRVADVLHRGDINIPGLWGDYENENIGTGAAVYKGFDTDERKHQFRSLVQGRGIVITENDDDITIEAKRIPISSIESSAQDPDDPAYDPENPPYQPAGYVPMADGEGGTYWVNPDHDFRVTLSADGLTCTVQSGTVYWHVPKETELADAGFEMTDANSTVFDLTAYSGTLWIELSIKYEYAGDVDISVYPTLTDPANKPYIEDILPGSITYRTTLARLAYVSQPTPHYTIARIHHVGSVYLPAPFSVLVDADDEAPRYLFNCFEDALKDEESSGFLEGTDGKITVAKVDDPGDLAKLLKLYLSREDHAIVDERINIGNGVGVFAGYNAIDTVYEYYSLYQLEGVRILLDSAAGDIEIEARHYNADTTGVPVLEWDEINFAYAHYRLNGYGPLQITAGDTTEPIDIRIVSKTGDPLDPNHPAGTALLADGSGGTEWGNAAANIANIGTGQGEVFAGYDIATETNNLRKLAHDEGVKISQDADTITIEAKHVNGSDGGWTDSKAGIVVWSAAARSYLHRTLLAEEGIRLQQLDTNIRIRAEHQNGSGLGETFGAWDSIDEVYKHRRIRGENGVKTSTEEGADAPIVIEANIDTTETGTVKVLSRVVVDKENKQILGYKATLSLAIGENGKLKLTLVEDEEPELIHQGGDCDEEPAP